MVQLTKDVELTLHVVLETRFQRNRLHHEPNLVVVPLLDYLEYAILARPEAVSDLEELLYLLGLQDTFHPSEQLGVHIVVRQILVVKAVELGRLKGMLTLETCISMGPFAFIKFIVVFVPL